MDKELETVKQAEPYIVVTGRAGHRNAQYFVCVEKALITESKSFLDCVIDLICTYYVYDMEYPKAIHNIFYFIQHVIFEIKDSKKLPISLTTLLQNIEACHD